MSHPLEPAPAPIGGHAWRMNVRLMRASVIRGTRLTGIFASVAVHGVAVAGMAVAWNQFADGSREHGPSSMEAHATAALEVSAPMAREAVAEATAVAMAPPPAAAPGEATSLRRLEPSPVGTLAMRDVPDVDAEDSSPSTMTTAARPAKSPTTLVEASATPPPAPSSPTLARSPVQPAVATLGKTQADLPGKAAQSSVAAGGSGQGLPAALHNPRPVYPPELMAARIEGLVKLRVQLADDGRVKSATVSKSSGYTAFDRAALEVIYRWRFTASTERAPSKRVLTVPIRFGIIP
jgi:TonB family protein